MTESVYNAGCIFQHPVHGLRGCGESEREKERGELGLSDAARGLVYSRASDDNVHAALNLPLLPPSSRELGRGVVPPPPSFFFHRSFLPLHYIIFHSFRRTFPSVASRCAPPSSPSFAITIFFLFSFVRVDLLLLFPFLCSYFIRAGVSSRLAEKV